MSATPYPIKTEDELVFSFVSEGPKGRIVKMVKYQEVGSGIYNLGFGDQIEDSLDFDDMAETNNGDMKKVLATVIETIFAFFEHHPEKSIYIEGSTTTRTDLYVRMALNYADSLGKNLKIFGGWKHSKPEPFSKNKNYDYLVIKKK